VRIFAALALPPRVIARIVGWQEEQKKLHPSLRWVKEDNLHITLRFFGNLESGALNRIRSVLENWKPGHLGFSLERVGTFGGRGSPSVYWLGGDFPPQVTEIAGRLGRIPDERGRYGGGTFIPHLTVARRKGGPVPMPAFPGEVRGVLSTMWLVNSTLTPEGPEYEFLETYDLNGN